MIAGLSSGSLPLVKALGDEIVYLAKKPLEMCSTMTEGIGFSVANAVFLPLERALDSISNLVIYFQIYFRLEVIEFQENF